MSLSASDRGRLRHITGWWLLVVLFTGPLVRGHAAEEANREAAAVKRVPASAAVTAPPATIPAAASISTSASASTSAGILVVRRQEAREHPEDALAWIRLGQALMQESRDLGGHANLEEAEAAFRRAHTLAPRDPEAAIGLAWVSNTRHEFEEGSRWAQAALALDPRQTDAHALLGDAAVEKGDFELALDHYQTCLDLRPDLSSYSRAAHVLHLTGDTLRAQALMSRAIAAGGPYPENSAWCRSQLALMCLDTGALLPAQQHAERALRDAPENPVVQIALARVRLAQGRALDAITLLQRAATLAPGVPVLALLAEAQRQAGRDSDVRETTRRILALHEQHAAAHRHARGGTPGTEEPATTHGDADLARFLADHDLDLDRALEEAERAHREFPHPRHLDTLAWCYFKKGRYPEAARTIRKALRWNTPDASMHFHAGMILSRLGDAPGAMKALSHALNLNPNFHALHARTAAETIAALRSRP